MKPGTTVHRGSVMPFAAVLLITAFTLFSSPAWAQEPPIPEMPLWEDRMTTFGMQHCERYEDPGFTDEPEENKLRHVQYDAERVFYQIGDYTGDPTWSTDTFPDFSLACAQRAEAFYRDEYVLPRNGVVPGFRNETTGLRVDYERTVDELSDDAVILLSENADFAREDTPLPWTESANMSREVAFTILSYINAEAVDPDPRPQWQVDRRDALVNQAYDHMDQWFVPPFAWPSADCNQSPGDACRLAPFMVGLTAHTLIRDWEETNDTRLIPALQLAADWLWDHAWIQQEESMWEECRDPLHSCSLAGPPAPDLNLLIAPMYAFLYWQTGDPVDRQRGDQLFAGGVRRAFVSGSEGKQFNQSYMWSFDYVTWRAQASSLVGAWTFNDQDHTVPPPVDPTTATDSSGNRKTGTLLPESNGPTWTAAGKFGGALSFDGVDDYVEVTADPSFDVLPLTVSAWFKTGEDSGGRGIVGKYLAGPDIGWVLTFLHGSVCARYRPDDANHVPDDGDSCMAPLEPFYDNQWHHIAYVVDEDGDRLFIDAATLMPAGPRPWVGSPVATSTTYPVHIGRVPAGSVSFPAFNGTIDDVRIYNHALTDQEIAALYAEGQ